MRFLPALSSILIMLFMPMSAQTQQGDYDPRTLSVKNRFSQNTLKAMAKPFIGVTMDGQVQPGLYPVHATGVSTRPVVMAAAEFLATLKSYQKVRSVYSVEDPEWRRWSNVDVGIFARQGISLKEMSDGQRETAMKLMRESLSAKGLQLSMDIMKTDQALREINEDILSFDEDQYFFKIMGLPSTTEPWGWQVNGHHLLISYFVLGDQVVMSPTFLGGEPVNIKTGKYAGTRILQQEQDFGLAMMRSLKEEQREAATLAADKLHNNNQGEANKDNLVLNFEGVPVTGFSDKQKQQLLELVELFVGNMRQGHADIRMEEIVAHLDNTWFAWVGDVTDDAVFYYRIHSPVVLIEFDHQIPVGTSILNPQDKPIRDHIHVVIRTPNGNDYGKDLLRQHLEHHAH